MLIAVVAAACAGAAGCGADDQGAGSPAATVPTSPAASTGPALGAEEFRTRARAVCAAFAERVEVLGRGAPTADGLRTMLPMAQEELDGLARLSPPPELAAGFRRGLEGKRGVIEGVRAVLADVDAGATLPEALARHAPEAADRRGREAFTALGIAECARSGG